jgi:peptidoglycan/LPS O-acetylase OafA/YrhL
MVQLWYEPFFDGTSWDGPAWSISAEWLAYLVFGLLILVIFRMATVTRARTLLLLAFIASLPPIILLLASGHFYTPWSWLPRIVAQFLAGALACAAVRRLRLTDRSRRVAGYSAIALTAAGVAILYYYDAHPVNGMIDPGGLVDILFMPVVVTLAIGVGSLPALLSTRLLVYGGQISFSLYMVHELVHTSWTWVVQEFSLDIPKAIQKFVVVGLIAAAVAGAMLLFHTVEEPARRWMRRMVDFRDVKTIRAELPADPTGKLASIDGARDGRPPRSARAG